MQTRFIGGEMQIRPDPGGAGHPRWLLLGVAAIGLHQVQSLLAEPKERPFRLAALLGLGLLPLTLLLPQRPRAMLTLLPAVPAVAGAVVGHLVPIVRTGRMPPATETAPLNLAGGALLIATAIAQLRSGTAQG